MHEYVAIVPVIGPASGYAIRSIPDVRNLQWTSPSQLRLNEMTYDLTTAPPVEIQ